MLLKIIQTMDSTGHSLSGSSKSRAGAQGRWARSWQCSLHRQGSDHPDQGTVLLYQSRTRLIAVVGPITQSQTQWGNEPCLGSIHSGEAGGRTRVKTGDRANYGVGPGPIQQVGQ